MGHDQRLVEFYKTLECRQGFSSEILFHEARVEFRRAWLRDLLGALLDGGYAAPSGKTSPAGCGPARLRLDMENAWLWLYYRVEGEGELPPLGPKARFRGSPACVPQGNPMAARILDAKAGRDRFPASRAWEGLRGRTLRHRANGGERRSEGEYILGPR